MQAFMWDEKSVIGSIQNPQDKTFIDLGAGYGRVLPTVATVAKKVIAIELNPGMLGELQKRAKKYPNVEPVVGDMTRLPEVLDTASLSPAVFLLLQNTLGTIENGADRVFPSIMEAVGKEQAELVLALFRQQALGSWGMKFYEHIKEMAGQPDYQKTRPDLGEYVSKTGYTSKWRSDEEIQQIVDSVNGKIVKEKATNEYRVMLISMNQRARK